MADKIDNSYDKDMMQASVTRYRENSKIRSNGVREVSKGVYAKALEENHGVTEEDIDRVQRAVDFETTAAGHLAMSDIETRVSEASEEEMKDDSFRRSMSATVRLPTHRGSTEVTFHPEVYERVPHKGEDDGSPPFKTTYGRLSTTINTQGRIFKDFQKEADKKMRKILGVDTAE